VHDPCVNHVLLIDGLLLTGPMGTIPPTFNHRPTLVVNYPHRTIDSLVLDLQTILSSLKRLSRTYMAQVS
jgi:hypothetical protein